MRGGGPNSKKTQTTNSCENLRTKRKREGEKGEIEKIMLVETELTKELQYVPDKMEISPKFYKPLNLQKMEIC